MNAFIFTLVGMLVFAVYNTFVLRKFGVPQSLSDSFYLWNGVKKGLGYIFTLMMFALALCLMPGCLEITEVITSWSHNLTMLPFLAAASIAFVGAAPMFKDSILENKVHTISAYLAAAFSSIWGSVVCYSVAGITIPAAAIFVLIAAAATKTIRSSKNYRLEMIAFLSTFATNNTQLI